MKYEDLVKTHGDKAATIWRQICKLGGFGDVLPVEGSSLDFTGLDGDTKKAVDNLLKKKRR